MTDDHVFYYDIVCVKCQAIVDHLRIENAWVEYLEDRSKDAINLHIERYTHD